MSHGATAMPARGRTTARDIFQWLSYLQYPAMLAAIAYTVKSAWAVAAVGSAGWPPVFDDGNYVLLYAGIGIGLGHAVVGRAVRVHPHFAQGVAGGTVPQFFGQNALGGRIIGNRMRRRLYGSGALAERGILASENRAMDGHGACPFAKQLREEV